MATPAAAANLAPLALLVSSPLAGLLGAFAGRRFRFRGGAAHVATLAARRPDLLGLVLVL